MIGDMFYSEYLAIQEKYALKRREFMPPFSVMMTIAFSLHLLAIIIWSLLPAPVDVTPPFRALHLKFGSPTGTVHNAASSGNATAAALDAALAQASAPKPSPPITRPDASAPKSLVNNAPARTERKPNLSALAPASGRQSIAAFRSGLPGTNVGKASAGEGVAFGSPMGTDASGGEEVARRYEQMLSGWIMQHRIYPLEAEREGIEGTAILRIRINRGGVIQFVSIERSAGNPLLDAAVIQTARASNPVPAVPVAYPGGDLLEFKIAIEFKLVR